MLSLISNNLFYPQMKRSFLFLKKKSPFFKISSIYLYFLCLLQLLHHSLNLIFDCLQPMSRYQIFILNLRNFHGIWLLSVCAASKRGLEGRIRMQQNKILGQATTWSKTIIIIRLREKNIYRSIANLVRKENG